jgi:putative membrane protein
MTHRHLLAFMLAGAGCAAMPAHAQFGNPGFQVPGTVQAQPGVPAPNPYNTVDRLFVKLLGAGNAGEVALAKLADAKASRTGTRGFARRMAQDHGQAAPRLAAVARTMNLPATPESDADQKATHARLEALQGPAFDAAYLQSQLIDHQKTVQLLVWQIGQGQDAALQAFAKELLPTVMDHLREAQALYAESTGAGLQGLAVADLPDEGTSRRRAAP